MIGGSVQEVFLDKFNIKISYFESLDTAAEFVIEKKPGSLVALNAEKLVRMYNNPDLLSGLKNSIFYPDGEPVTWFSPLNSCRIPGVELWLKIIEKLNFTNGKVLLIGASEAVANSTHQELRGKFPYLTFSSLDGFQTYQTYFNELIRFSPDLVFVAMGSPKQELLIADMQKHHPNCTYMGVGGSFNVLVGEVKRAPIIFRKLGVEFLYRLLKEPKRILRQKNYLKFLYLYFSDKFQLRIKHKSKPIYQ